MHKYLVYSLIALALLVILAISWYGWVNSGLSLLQLDSFFC